MPHAVEVLSVVIQHLSLGASDAEAMGVAHLGRTCRVLHAAAEPMLQRRAAHEALVTAMERLDPEGVRAAIATCPTIATAPWNGTPLIVCALMTWGKARNAMLDAMDEEDEEEKEEKEEAGSQERVAIVADLLAAGADPHARHQPDGTTALHHAVSFPPVARQLLEAGADPQAADGTGATPLHAVMWARLRGKAMVALVQDLLAAGASVRAVRTLLHRDEDGHTGWTPLHTAAHAVSYVYIDGDYDTEIVADVLRVLIDAGADARAATSRGLTALHCLMANERGATLSAAECLLDAGAVVDARDGDGNTPLHALCSNFGMTQASGSEDIMEVLLERGADMDARDAAGRTPLHRTFPLVYDDDDEGRINFMWCLLENGADVTARDNAGRTPLHAAAVIGMRVFVEGLLEWDADVNARDAAGRTPLHYAAGPYVGPGEDVPQPQKVYSWDPVKDRLKAVEDLVEYGADLDALDESGRTPLVVCAARVANDPIAAFLIARDASVASENPLVRALKHRLR